MVQKYTLKNGIPVFIVEMHASPVVSIQIWIKRGSAHESERVAGISHFLEHALFKGTRKRKVGEIASEIEGHGGEINAFTSFEETAYYSTLASRYFESGMDVMADLIQNPLFEAGETDREREVILEEIKRAHDSASKMVSTNLWNKCFSGTPFGRPVLGFQETVSRITSTTLKEYFKKNYHAGTTSLFIIGDITSSQAIALAQKKFSRMPIVRGPISPISFRGVQLRSPVIVSIGRDIKECHLQIGFCTPEITHPSIPSIDLMCSSVGQGESSRLYQELVKKQQLALDVQMGLVATSRCGIATLAMTTIADKLKPAIKEALSILSEAARTGIDENEIERVKHSLEAEVISGKETVDGYARRLGYYYCQFNDPEYEKKYLESVFSVSADEATESLSQFLRKKPVLSLGHPNDFKMDRKELLDLLSATRKTTRLKSNLPAIPEMVEKEGVRYISKRITHLPVVSIKIIFPGGAIMDPPGKFGLSTLFHRVWNAGTRSFNSLQIAHILESLGASLQGFSGRNCLGFDVEFLAKHWLVMKPILREILTEPTFPEEEFLIEKELILRAIDSEKDSPSNMCHLNFLKTMYPDHPYGRSILGTRESISSITIDDLKQHFKQCIHREKMIVSSVGCFPGKDWIEELYGLGNLLPHHGRTPPDLKPIQENRTPRLVTEEKNPLFQSHLLLGFLGCSFSDPERYPLKLLSSCLAGQGGRLFLHLRDQQSLAYSVSPIHLDGPIRGVFAFYIGCSPEKLGRAIQGIRKEIDKVLLKLIPSSELKRAKEYWTGRFELDLQRYSTQASMYALDEYYGLGYLNSLEIPKIIKSVSSNDIMEAARKYLRLESPTFSVVHPEKLPDEQILSCWA